jgi:hypothetical protein
MPQPVTFRPKSKLVRFIHPEHRTRNGRAMAAAFALRRSIKETALSVNTTELRTEKQIAAICRTKFNCPDDDIAVCAHTVEDYNLAAGYVGIAVTATNRQGRHTGWIYQHNVSQGVPYQVDARPGDPSHSLVNYFGILSTSEEDRLTLRLANSPRMTVFKGKRRKTR